MGFDSILWKEWYNCQNCCWMMVTQDLRRVLVLQINFPVFAGFKLLRYDEIRYFVILFRMERRWKIAGSFLRVTLLVKRPMVVYIHCVNDAGFKKFTLQSDTVFFDTPWDRKKCRWFVIRDQRMVSREEQRNQSGSCEVPISSKQLTNQAQWLRSRFYLLSSSSLSPPFRYASYPSHCVVWCWSMMVVSTDLRFHSQPFFALLNLRIIFVSYTI